MSMLDESDEASHPRPAIQARPKIFIPTYAAISFAGFIMSCLGWLIGGVGCYVATKVGRESPEIGLLISAGSVAVGFMLVLLGCLARAIRDMAINSWHLRRS
jgi:hypothetical protein